MSVCHYSCTACSNPILPGYCSACPSTRYLFDSNCLCSGLFQVQSSACSDQQSVSSLTQTMASIASVLYYINIGIHLIAIIMMVSRVHSIKVKKLIDLMQVHYGIYVCRYEYDVICRYWIDNYMQVMSLISIYPYRQGEVAQRSLSAMGAFNFNYMDSIFCSGPYCTSYSALISPGLTLLLFLAIVIVGFIVVNIILHKEKDIIYIRDGTNPSYNQYDSVAFVQYWLASYGGIVMIYMDSTIVQTSIAISRVITISNWCLLFLIPYAILVVLAIRFQLSLINNSSQHALRYRNQHVFPYLYDQYYHLNYIDHIFTLKRRVNHKNDEPRQQDKQKEDKHSLFYPTSNLLAVELVYKAGLSMCAVLAYSYQPSVLAFALVISLVVWMCYMKSFMIYQRSDLVFYLVTVAVYVLGLSTYWISNVFTWVVFSVMCAGTLLIAAYLIVVIYGWRKDREGVMLINAFRDTIDHINKDSERDSSSLEELSADIGKLAKQFNNNLNMNPTNPNPTNPPTSNQQAYQSMASRKPTKRQLRRMETGRKQSQTQGKRLAESLQIESQLNNSQQLLVDKLISQMKSVPVKQENIFQQQSP